MKQPEQLKFVASDGSLPRQAWPSECFKRAFTVPVGKMLTNQEMALLFAYKTICKFQLDVRKRKLQEKQG